MNERTLAPQRRSRGGRPPRHEAEEAGTRIIDTATRLFASQGFAATSVEQVAASCGAGKDTIYRRFPSKVALFEAVVDQARARAVEPLQGVALEGRDTLERLKNLLRSFLAVNMRPDLIALKRITFSETVMSGKSGPVPSQPDPLMGMLLEAVEACQADGSVKAGDPGLIAAHLIHSLVAIPTTNAMLGGADYESSEAVDAHFDRTWEWLMAGVVTSPGRDAR